MERVVEQVGTLFTGRAYVLTVLSGLLTITMERYLYRRRDYEREARVCAFFGWTYLIGGTALYVLVVILNRLLT